MKDDSYNSLCETLYIFANNYVGAVGNSSDCRYNEIGEEFVEFAIYFATSEEAVNIWQEWIKAYKKFALYHFTGKLSDSGKFCKIYWRVKPEVKINDDGQKSLYARLLVSNRGYKFESINELD